MDVTPNYIFTPKWATTDEVAAKAQQLNTDLKVLTERINSTLAATQLKAAHRGTFAGYNIYSDEVYMVIDNKLLPVTHSATNQGEKELIIEAANALLAAANQILTAKPSVIPTPQVAIAAPPTFKRQGAPKKRTVTPQRDALREKDMEIAHLRGQLEALSRDNFYLMSRNTELEGTLAHYHQTLHQQDSQIQWLTHELQQTQAQLDENVSYIEQLQHQLLQEQQKSRELEAKLLSVRKLNHTLKSELESKTESIITLTRELKSTKQIITTKDDEIRQLSSHIAQASSSLEASSLRIQTLEAENVALDDTLQVSIEKSKAQEEALEVYRTRENTLKSQIMSLKTTQTALNVEKETLIAEISHLELTSVQLASESAQVRDLKSKLSEIEETLETQEKTMRALTKSLRESQAEALILFKENGQLQKQKRELEGNIQRLERQLRDATTESCEQKSELTELNDKLKQSERERSQLQDSLQTQAIELARTIAENKLLQIQAVQTVRLESDLIERDKPQRGATHALSSFRASSEHERASLHQALTAIEAIEAIAPEPLSGVSSEENPIELLESRLLELQKEKDDLSVKLAEASRNSASFEETRAELALMKDELNALKRQYTTLEEINRSLEFQISNLRATERENAELSKKISHLEAALQNNLARLTEINAATQQKTEEIAPKLGELQKLRQTLLSSTGADVKIDLEKGDMLDQLDRMVDELTPLIAELVRKKDLAESNLETLKETIVQQQQMIEDLHQKQELDQKTTERLLQEEKKTQLIKNEVFDILMIFLNNPPIDLNHAIDTFKIAHGEMLTITQINALDRLIEAKQAERESKSLRAELNLILGHVRTFASPEKPTQINPIAELGRIVEQHQHLETDRSKLIKENVKLKEELDRSKEMIRTKTTEIAKQKQAFEMQLDSLITDRYKKDAILKQAEHELKETLRIVEKLKSEKEVTTREKEEIEAKIALLPIDAKLFLENPSKEIEKAIQKLNAIIQKQRDELSQSQINIQEKEAEISELIDKIETLETTLSEAGELGLILSEENEYIRQQLKDAEARYTRELESKEEEISSLREGLTRNARLAEAGNERLDQLRANLSAILEEKKAIDLKVTTNEEELRILRGENILLKSKVIDLTSSMETKAETLNKLTATMKRALLQQSPI
jgi:chromosome segregation ATPase